MMPIRKSQTKKKWYQLWYVQLLIIIGIILFFGVSCCLIYLFCFKTTKKPYEGRLKDAFQSNNKLGIHRVNGGEFNTTLHINIDNEGGNKLEYPHNNNLNTYYKNTFPKEWKTINDGVEDYIYFYINDKQRDAIRNKYKIGKKA